MEIRKIGVVGAGTMGSGIALACSQGGYEVVMADTEQKFVDAAFERIKGSLARFVKSGKIAQEDVERVVGRIKGTVDLQEAGKDADLTIEAIFEDVEAKKAVFRELDDICPERTILASNTSTIMITELASAVRRREKCIGMHWFVPAQVMRLIEVIRSAETSDETFDTIVDLAKRLGKVPVEASDGPGFFTSRYIGSYFMEAIRLFESGVAGIREIDTMCKLGFGWPMGPFEIMDLTGLDIAMHASEYVSKEIGEPRYVVPITMKKLVKAGYIGNKPGSKGGWYDYYKIEKEK
jgi:3-hydroxybutyryl-CoA dehydrogenase